VSPASPRALAIGYLTTDLLIKVNRFARTDEEVPMLTFGEYPGGSAANVAVGLSRLGIPAALLCCVGDDDRGRRGVQVLERDSVATSPIVTSPTGLKSSYVVGVIDERGERQLYTYAGAGEELRPEHLTPEHLKGVTHVHICTLGPEFVERALILAQNSGDRIMLSLDPGTLGLASERRDRLRALLPQVDLLFVNSVELSLLTGVADPEALAAHADSLPPRIAVKLGARGSVLFRRGAPTVSAPAFAVDTVDTTGAGDAFAVGYLAGWIWGASDQDLAGLSNAVAALSTRAYGCRDGLPSLDQVRSFLRARGPLPS
jgi:ribokinase